MRQIIRQCDRDVKTGRAAKIKKIMKRCKRRIKEEQQKHDCRRCACQNAVEGHRDYNGNPLLIKCQHRKYAHLAKEEQQCNLFRSNG